MAQLQTLIQETQAFDTAPVADPFAGPTLLTGRAAAVFFHEVFGHRAEGFRQKDIAEGRTFTSKIGEKIMPDFISIKDDPTEASSTARCSWEIILSMTKACPRRTLFVDHGVLKTFLMSRSPLVKIPQSNGHATASWATRRSRARAT